MKIICFLKNKIKNTINKKFIPNNLKSNSFLSNWKIDSSEIYLSMGDVSLAKIYKKKSEIDKVKIYILCPTKFCLHNVTLGKYQRTKMHMKICLCIKYIASNICFGPKWENKSMKQSRKFVRKYLSLSRIGSVSQKISSRMSPEKINGLFKVNWQYFNYGAAKISTYGATHKKIANSHHLEWKLRLCLFVHVRRGKAIKNQ